MEKINKGKNIYFALIMGVVLIGFLFFTEKKSPAEENTESNIDGWKTYENQQMGFSIQYPPDSEVKTDGNSVVIDFPFIPGTLLTDKYLKITVRNIRSPEKCSNPAQTIINNTEMVRIGSIDFKKENGSEGAAGSIYDSISYSTIDKGRCFGLSFILRYANPTSFYPNQPPDFNRQKETMVFEQIVSTFRPF